MAQEQEYMAQEWGYMAQEQEYMMAKPDLARRVPPSWMDGPAALAAIIGALPDGVIIFDAGWRVVALNHALHALVHWPQDMIGLHISALPHVGLAGQDRAGLIQSAGEVEERALAGAIDDVELDNPPRCLRRYSSAIWAQPHGPRTPDECPVAYIVIYRDVTAEKRTERRLSALSRVIETTLGASSFGAMCDRALVALTELLDSDSGSIQVYDHAAPPDRALRLVAWHGISDQAASTWTALPLGAGLSGQAALRRETIVVGRHAETPPEAAGAYDLADGQPGAARVAVPILARGRLLGVLNIAAQQERSWSEPDLSLLHTLSNQLAAALEAEELRAAASAAAAAREADRLKGELLSTVSHELRTPLGAIKGFASGLLHYGDMLDDAQRVESLRAIDDASDRLTELIDNVLDLQRLESGRLSVAYGQVDLAPIVATVAREMAPRAPGHTINIVIGPGAFVVQGDARRLRQIIQNLVENAVKYSPHGGRVTARLLAHPRSIELRIDDEGIGIPADQLVPIFERFHRVDSSMTRRIGGTGLGLAIVKGLVTAHGGAIHAESAGEGHGSRFVTILPRARIENEDDHGEGPYHSCG